MQAVCYQKKGDLLFGLFGCISFSSYSKRKNHGSACFYSLFLEWISFILIYCLLNSCHYQDTLKVCPPCSAEWQNLVPEVLCCLKYSSICWKASSMLAKSSSSEMRKLVMDNFALRVATFAFVKK